MTVTGSAQLDKENAAGTTGEQRQFAVDADGQATNQAFSVEDGVQRGQVTTTVNLAWRLRKSNALANTPLIAPAMLPTEEGSATVQIQAPFRVSSSGGRNQLTWRAVRAIREDTAGGGATLSLPVAASGDFTDDGRGSLTVSPSLVFQGQNAITNSTPQVSGTILGIGVSQAGPQYQQQVAETDTLTRSFISELNVQSPAPPTPPPTPAPLSPPFPISFGVRSDRLRNRREIVEWYQGLDPTIKADVEEGHRDVRLEGHASTTGTDEFNEGLSRRRANRVRDLLRDIAGSRVSFDIRALGAFNPHPGSHGEDEAERRVDLTIASPVAGRTPVVQTGTD